MEGLKIRKSLLEQFPLNGEVGFFFFCLFGGRRGYSERMSFTYLESLFTHIFSSSSSYFIEVRWFYGNQRGFPSKCLILS